MSEGQVLIRARNLTKRYGEFQALKDVSFDVPLGSCFGLLGPNGAGKSTTLRLITAFLAPTSGDLTVMGMDPQRQARRLKACMGVVHQEDNLDGDLNVLDNLVVYASYFDIQKPQALARARELLAFMQLEAKQKAPIHSLSGGMRRRLMIARALMNRPALLVLDEPTTGLDPQARHLIWERLRGLKAEGVSMLLCTHYMEEAERLCDELVLLHEGAIVDQGAPAVLIHRVAGRRVVELPVRFLEEVQAAALEHGGNGMHWQTAHGSVYLYFHDAGHPALAALKARHDVGVYRQPNLEDVFLLHTGRELVD